ncbi:hypothetical protein GGC63_006317 [Paenibacillus sp. OAS669]|nr:hypothetical protein [Paenibacillus sp. OAS669]
MRVYLSKDPPLPKQPVKCKGCEWGRWEGTKQICIRLPCIKDGGEK